MNEARAMRYRRFFGFALTLAFAELFFAGFGAARLAAAGRCAGINPAFSTWRTQ